MQRVCLPPSLTLGTIDHLVSILKLLLTNPEPEACASILRGHEKMVQHVLDRSATMRLGPSVRRWF
eukprot:6188543-Pleurochrysis_carterae.AAC.7